MSRYDAYTNPPVTYLQWAESALLAIDNSTFTTVNTSIAYAQALIALAEAQMKGSTRA